MEAKHTEGRFERDEQTDRITYLKTPMDFGSGDWSSLKLARYYGDSTRQTAAVTLHKDVPERVQLALEFGSFGATVHISAHQARQIAMALAEAASDIDRMALDAKLAEEPAQLDFVNSTWPQMADEEMA